MKSLWAAMLASFLASLTLVGALLYFLFQAVEAVRGADIEDVITHMLSLAAGAVGAAVVAFSYAWAASICAAKGRGVRETLVCGVRTMPVVLVSVLAKVVAVLGGAAGAVLAAMQGLPPVLATLYVFVGFGIVVALAWVEAFADRGVDAFRLSVRALLRLPHHSLLCTLAGIIAVYMGQTLALLWFPAGLVVTWTVGIPLCAQAYVRWSEVVRRDIGEG